MDNWIRCHPVFRPERVEIRTLDDGRFYGVSVWPDGADGGVTDPFVERADAVLAAGEIWPDTPARDPERSEDG